MYGLKAGRSRVERTSGLIERPLSTRAGVVPAVTKITPIAGSTYGGNPITVTGSGFTGATGVMFGSKSAGFIVDSDSQIVAISPGESAGTVDVTVMNLSGTSATSAKDKFTYVAITRIPVQFNRRIFVTNLEQSIEWADNIPGNIPAPVNRGVNAYPYNSALEWIDNLTGDIPVPGNRSINVYQYGSLEMMDNLTGNVPSLVNRGVNVYKYGSFTRKS